MYRALWFALIGTLIGSIYNVVLLTNEFNAVKQALTEAENKNEKLAKRLLDEEKFGAIVSAEADRSSRQVIEMELELRRVRKSAEQLLRAAPAETYGPL